MTSTLQILYEDNHLLVVVKPAGLLAQGDRTGDVTTLELAKQYIKTEYDRPGNVFLGLVHRLDRPVSGIMVFARTSKAASRLARAFHDRDVEKTYLAVVLGTVEADDGDLSGYVERTHLRSRLASRPGAKAREATLSYTVLARAGGQSLVEVMPQTGRHHQIRLQLSAAGHPIVGDIKYRAPEPLRDKSIALHAVRLKFPHPVREEVVALTAPPPTGPPWARFASHIARYVK